MKNKKGFTLIEVIVSLVIIISISTLVIVNLKKESVDDVRKLENEIISSSDVYFSLNNSKIKELEDNYGYLVLTVQELLDMGIVDENFLKNKLTSELLGSEVDNYKKLVIKKIDNNLNEDGLLGLYDIIYPYTINSNISLIFDNYLYYGNITGINICKLGLTDNIKYFNMNYEVSNLSVSDYEKEEPNNLWCEMIPETNNLYEYSFCNSNTSCEDSNIIYGYRKMDVCNLREIKVYDGEEEFNTDSWVNNSSEIKVKINGDSSDSCGNYFKLKDNINNNLADEFTLTFTENGENIEKKYSIVERDETINFTEKEVEFPSESFIFKVDLNGPNIGNYESHGNNYKVTIKDEVSKLDYYKIGDEPENHRCNNNSECIIE